MELPVSVFYGTMAFFLALPILGFILRMQIPISVFMFASGSLILALLLAVDTLQVHEQDNVQVTTYNATTIIENKTPFDFSLEGENYQLKVFWIFIAVLLLLGGVLIEFKFK